MKIRILFVFLGSEWSKVSTTKFYNRQDHKSEKKIILFRMYCIVNGKIGKNLHTSHRNSLRVTTRW